MAALGGLLALIGLTGLVVGVVGLIRPIQTLRITNPRIASAVLVTGFVVMMIGGAITPTDGADKSAVAGLEAPTEAPQAAPTPTAVQTVTPPSSATPTVAPSVTALPAATTPAPSIEQRAEKSIRDNKNAVTSGSNLDNLQIAFDSNVGLLTVSIRPNKPEKDTQFITNGSALAIIVGKAIWTTYDEVQRISVQVFRETKDDHGNLQAEQMAVADYGRGNGLKYNYGNLKNQPDDDNKLMYCTADFYAVSERVWSAIKDKGCMKARAGGFNPTPDQQLLILGLPAVADAPKPTTAPTQMPTATPVPEVVAAQGGPITFFAYSLGFMGIHVHFLTWVKNTGTVPIEITDLGYQMTSPSGAVIEVGDIPQSHPRKIGPGEFAAIGRTVTADAATRTSDVGGVTVTFKTKKASNADNRLQVLSAQYRGADSFGDVTVVGEVRNSSSAPYDDINIAVVLVDSAGDWIGYATANIPVEKLAPGQVAQFVTDADLPNDLFRGRVADILVFAYDK